MFRTGLRSQGFGRHRVGSCSCVRGWTRTEARGCGASCVALSVRIVNEGMRHPVPGRRSVEATGPVGIRTADFGGRARIGVETQFNQRGSAPFVPVAKLGGGQPVT